MTTDFQLRKNEDIVRNMEASIKRARGIYHGEFGEEECLADTIVDIGIAMFERGYKGETKV